MKKGKGKQKKRKMQVKEHQRPRRSCPINKTDKKTRKRNKARPSRDVARSTAQSLNQCKGNQNQSSTSVSVLVSLVSAASPSVSLSLESSESRLVFFLGGWPVLRACIWPAMESTTTLVLVFESNIKVNQNDTRSRQDLPSSGSLISSSSATSAALAGSSMCSVISIRWSRPR